MCCHGCRLAPFYLSSIILSQNAMIMPFRHQSNRHMLRWMTLSVPRCSISSCVFLSTYHNGVPSSRSPESDFFCLRMGRLCWGRKAPGARGSKEPNALIEFASNNNVIEFNLIILTCFYSLLYNWFISP